MIEKENVNKLGEYSTHICGEIKKSISENISELTSSVSMLSDMQRIIDELRNVITEQHRTIDGLNRELEKNRTLLSEKEEEIKKLRIKEEEYSKLEINAVQIAVTLDTVSKKESLLNNQITQLETDRVAFEEEKKKLEKERDEALDKAEKVKGERDEANAFRDRAVKEKNDSISELNKKKSEYEKKIKEHNDRNKELEDLMKWYKGYAIALDQKIIDYFGGREEGLKNHFYHYLNDNSKLEEIRVHFPEFKMEKILVENNEVNDFNSSEEGKEREKQTEKLANRKYYEAVQKVSSQSGTE